MRAPVSEVFTAAAPEPSTWLVMIGGTFAIGAMLRHRRREGVAGAMLATA